MDVTIDDRFVRRFAHDGDCNDSCREVRLCGSGDRIQVHHMRPQGPETEGNLPADVGHGEADARPSRWWSVISARGIPRWSPAVVELSGPGEPDDAKVHSVRRADEKVTREPEWSDEGTRQPPTTSWGFHTSRFGDARGASIKEAEDSLKASDASTPMPRTTSSYPAARPGIGRRVTRSLTRCPLECRKSSRRGDTRRRAQTNPRSVWGMCRAHRWSHAHPAGWPVHPRSRCQRL